MVQVIAHRGCSGAAPENTLAAFQLATERKCHLIELDLQFTRDLEPVVIHDPMVDRTTSGEGTVARLSFREIRQWDAGSWFDSAFERERVPSLGQVLDQVRPSGVDLLIELKESHLLMRGCRRVVEEILRAEMGSRCILQSFELEAVRHLHDLAPGVRLAALYQTATPDYVGEAMSVGADYLVLWRKLAGDFVVQDAHRNGFQVFVWTVDGPAEIRRMIDLGVDGIISNYPERVFRELR